MKTEREVIGRPFRKGHRNTHDVAAAGRKGKANSPWRHGLVSTPTSLRLRAEWSREGTRRK